MENKTENKAPKTGRTFILIVGFGATCLILIGFIVSANTNSALGGGISGGLIATGGSLLTAAILQYLKVRKVNKA